jgi:hypothetical protein
LHDLFLLSSWSFRTPIRKPAVYKNIGYGLQGFVVIAKSAIKAVMPVKTGIQKLLKLMDSVSRFACTE